MQVREATPEDADGIQTVHAEAIAELASADYTQEQIDAWLEPIESADYESITSSEYYYVVAENGEEIVGFGSVCSETPDGYESTVEGEITGVYVHPSVAGEGVGTSMLSALETEAQAQNIRRLGLESSINAVPFYESHGYERVRKLTHEFGGTVKGPAIEMQKRL